MNGPNDDLAGKAAALEGELLGKGEGPGGGPAPGAGPESGDTRAAGPSNAEIIAAILVPTFAIMAPAWRVSDVECALLGEAYAAVLDKYFPDFSLGVEFTAVLTTLAVFGPRWGRPMHAEKKPEAAGGEEKKPD